MNRRKIAAEFQLYRETVMSPLAGEVQVEECRKAFMAGAAALFGLVTAGLSPGGDVQAADIALLDELCGELRSEGSRALALGNKRARAKS